MSALKAGKRTIVAEVVTNLNRVCYRLAAVECNAALMRRLDIKFSLSLCVCGYNRADTAPPRGSCLY